MTNLNERPNTIRELREMIAIKTAPNHGLVELYKRSKEGR